MSPHLMVVGSHIVLPGDCLVAPIGLSEDSIIGISVPIRDMERTWGAKYTVIPKGPLGAPVVTPPL